MSRQEEKSELQKLLDALQHLTVQVEGLTTRLSRSRIQVMVLAGLVVFVLVLSGGLLWTVDDTRDAQAEIARASNAAVAVCVAANDQADRQQTLWEGLLALPSDNAPPTPEVLEAVNMLLDEAFTQEDCSLLGRRNLVLLGPYSRQTVTNRVAGHEGPAVRYGDSMVIEGELCNRTEGPVDVLTTLSWQAVDHPGTFVAVGIDIPQVRQPGCESFTIAGGNAFVNPMTPEVVAVAKELGPDVEWQIVGFEVPKLSDGSFGRREPFESEQFQIIP